MIETIAHLMSLDMPGVYDNAGGFASCASNKTSVYLERIPIRKGSKPLARIANISCTNVDDVDDFQLQYDVLIRVISENVKADVNGKYELVMNHCAYTQLINYIYEKHQVLHPWKCDTFMGVKICVHNGIPCDEDPVT